MKLLKSLLATAVALGISTSVLADNSNLSSMKGSAQNAVSSQVSGAKTAANEKVSAAKSAANEKVGTTKTAAAPHVNINTASAKQLQQLNGIGATKAKAIVAYRKKHGNFTSVEQLKNVSGIGDSIIDANKSRMILK